VGVPHGGDGGHHSRVARATGVLVADGLLSFFRDHIVRSRAVVLAGVAALVVSSVAVLQVVATAAVHVIVKV